MQHNNTIWVFLMTNLAQAVAKVEKISSFMTVPVKRYENLNFFSLIKLLSSETPYILKDERLELLSYDRPCIPWLT